MNFNGTLLRVKGKTTSPFHSTRQQYASLVQTAPFILGSTLRGALLSTMIRQIDCPQWIRLKKETDSKNISDIHTNCDISCSVKYFFLSYQIIFSFGLFNVDNKLSEDNETLYQRTTRIAIERENNSVSEGAIVNIETILPETPFIFEIILLGDALNHRENIKRAILNMPLGEGIGRYRSIGFGQFQIDTIEEFDLVEIIEQQLSDIKKVNGQKRIRLILSTPLVLGDEKGMVFPFSNRKILIDRLSKEIKSKVEVITRKESTTISIKDIEMKITPDYIHRFSYEIQNKENRLVARAGSEVILHFEDITTELYQQLAIASLIGLGEWSDWGYGRFKVKSLRERNNA